MKYILNGYFEDYYAPFHHIFNVFGLKAIIQSYFSLLFSEINQQIYQQESTCTVK